MLVNSIPTQINIRMSHYDRVVNSYSMRYIFFNIIDSPVINLPFKVSTSVIRTKIKKN